MKNYLNWKKKSNSTGKVIIGTVAGLAAGLTAGLLAAPRSGKETRHYLSTRTGEVLHKVGANFGENADRAVESGKESVEKIADKLNR